MAVAGRRQYFEHLNQKQASNERSEISFVKYML